MMKKRPSTIILGALLLIVSALSLFIGVLEIDLPVFYGNLPEEDVHLHFCGNMILYQW